MINLRNLVSRLKMLKEKLFFVVNPIAGGKNKGGFEKLLNQNLDLGKFDFEVVIWEDKSKLNQLMSGIKNEQPDAIIAVGGDGTVNHIAAQLLHSEIALGIVPFGSGNGLARHLRIPMDIAKAIRHLNQADKVLMDTGTLNDKVFVNVAGIGFDALIAGKFAQANSRGLKTYLKIILNELKNLQALTLRFAHHPSDHTETAWLLSIANGSQWGNDAIIAPQAVVNDGLFHMVLVKPMPWYQLPTLGLKMFAKNIQHHPAVKTQVIDKTEILLLNDDGQMLIAAHLDGEPHQMKAPIRIEINPASLLIMA